MNETEFISALRSLANAPSARDLRDDAAVLKVGGETLVLTHDTLVEGVHVRADEDPADIAWKLVAVNLSDLAAKGARPTGVLLSHMLGVGDDRFLQGLADVLTTYETPLLGGDTVSGENRRVWGCTAIGTATHCPVPSRSGAREGHAIFLTGAVGRAMLGFDERGTGSINDLAYRRPQPLLRQGIALAPWVGAMMDVSDGLLLDGERMAKASGLCFAIEKSAVPVADPGRADECLRWGDDYQLLFTAPADASLPLAAVRIGTVAPYRENFILLDGAPVEGSLGYMHG